jgi:hypothetical protein
MQGNMEHLPSIGYVIRLSDDLVINVTDRRANSKAFRIVQGEPREVSPETLPANLLLPHFRVAVERRIALANKRIARLVLRLDAYRKLQKQLQSPSLGALAKAFQDVLDISE